MWEETQNILSTFYRIISTDCNIYMKFWYEFQGYRWEFAFMINCMYIK